MKTGAGTYDALAKIEAVVHYPWDATALLCLEGRALRYTELRRRMTTLTEQHLSDSELTRTRHRLVRRRMISEGMGENGSKVYSITEAGRVRLRQIRTLLEIAPLLHRAESESPPGDTGWPTIEDERHWASNRP